MSRRIADLLIKIGADSYEFQQKAKSVEKSLSSMEKRLSSLGKSLSHFFIDTFFINTIPILKIIPILDGLF